MRWVSNCLFFFFNIHGFCTLLIVPLNPTTGPISNAPIDTIKTRIQKSQSAETGWRRFTEVTSDILRKEGWPAFYKGLTPRLLRVAPGQAITFMVYEKVRGWIEIVGAKWKEEAAAGI